VKLHWAAHELQQSLKHIHFWELDHRFQCQIAHRGQYGIDRLHVGVRRGHGTALLCSSRSRCFASVPASLERDRWPPTFLPYKRIWTSFCATPLQIVLVEPIMAAEEWTLVGAQPMVASDCCKYSYQLANPPHTLWLCAIAKTTLLARINCLPRHFE
jgi:hypothetical protein